MGRLFFQHFSGSRLYSCAACDMNLSSHDELISTRFTGASGKAFLFNKVINVNYGEKDTREMLTGRHIVRDVYCKNCDTKLGWIYEFAMEDSERYKEGRVILEKELICEREGLKNEV